MKRISLLLLLLMLLSSAFAEDSCMHEQVAELHTPETITSQVDGHVYRKSTEVICLNCESKLVLEVAVSFQGHVFCMADNLHFSDDGMHLCIFICKDCMHITPIEYACEGEKQCATYTPQLGAVPPVQLYQSMATWKEQNPDDAVRERFINRLSWYLDDDSE